MASLRKRNSYKTIEVPGVISIGFLTVSKLTHPPTAVGEWPVGPVVCLHISTMAD